MNTRKIFFVLGLCLFVGLLAYHPTREWVKATALLGMPALVVWGYRRRFSRFSLPWVLLSVVLVGLFVGYVFMLKGLPEKVAVKDILQKGDVLLAQREFDKAIATYQELAKYGQKAKMERKISEVKRQKEYQHQFEEAARLVEQGRYQEAKKKLMAIPPQAMVYREALKLLEKIDKQD